MDKSKLVIAGINTNARQLIEQFKAFYVDIKDLPLDDIEQMYHSDILFKNPVHEIRGIANLHQYMTHLCNNLEEGRFEYLDQQVSDGSAYIKWNMHFSHPKLGTKTITVRGISQIQFSDRIYYHEDVYDMGQMLYEHVPVIGTATRWLKNRLAQTDGEQ